MSLAPRGKRTDGLVSRYLNRKISTRITSWLLRRKIRITPNQMSVISFLVTVASFPFFLMALPLLAGVMIQLGSILDGVDGELARALNMESRKGAYFDALLDRVADITAILGAIMYAMRNENLFLIGLVGALALAGSLMVSYLHARGEGALGIHPALVGRFSGFASRDVRLFVLFLGGIFDFILESLFVIVCLSFSYVILKGLELYKAFAS